MTMSWPSIISLYLVSSIPLLIMLVAMYLIFQLGNIPKLYFWIYAAIEIFIAYGIPYIFLYSRISVFFTAGYLVSFIQPYLRPAVLLIIALLATWTKRAKVLAGAR